MTIHLVRPPGRKLRIGALQIREDQRTVHRGEEEIPLTPKEFEVLRALAARVGEVVPSKQLLWEVWNYPEGVRTRTLHVHVARLRAKLEEDRKNPRLIRTVPGIGYRLEAVP